jgi:hypothetical protein
MSAFKQVYDDTDNESGSDSESSRRLRFKVVRSSLDAGYTLNTLECHLFLEGRPIGAHDDDEPSMLIVLRFKIGRDYFVTKIPVYLGRIQDGEPINDTYDNNDMSQFYGYVNHIVEEGINRMKEDKKNIITN